MGGVQPTHISESTSPEEAEILASQKRKETEAENLRVKLARRRAGGLLSTDQSGTLG